MNQEEYKPRVPVVGGSSLLVIFAVLCLVVFAMLSLATLQADRRLFDNMSSNMGQYYAADNQAQAMLASIREGSVPEGVERDGDTYYFTVGVSDTMSLDCAADVRGDGSYEIVYWRLIRTAPWNGNFDTPVFVDEGF